MSCYERCDSQQVCRNDSTLFDLGYNFEAGGVEEAIQRRKILDLYRTVQELGYDFKKMSNRYDGSRPKDAFEIIKFLRRMSIPWEEQVMRDLVQYGTLEDHIKSLERESWLFP